MTTHPDPLANAWLERVDRLAAALPAHERVELVADLREHIDAALGHDDGSTIDDVLARLGDPAEVVAAAVGDGSDPRHGTTSSVGWPSSSAPAPVAPTAPPQGTTTTEKLVLTGLVVAGLSVILWPVAIAVWIAAVVGLFAASRWRGGEVGVALAIPPVVALLTLSPFVLFVTTARTCVSVEGGPETCTGGPSTVVSVLGLGLLLAMLVGVVLASRWLVRRVDGRALA